jgi:hypothetical protein
MSLLGRHVVELFEQGQKEEIASAFALAERLLSTGDESVQEAVVVGILETIQNVASHRPFGAAAFEPFLGPRSAEAWAELNRLWQGKETLMDVVAPGSGPRERTRPDEVENPELKAILEELTREPPD